MHSTSPHEWTRNRLVLVASAVGTWLSLRGRPVTSVESTRASHGEPEPFYKPPSSRRATEAAPSAATPIVFGAGIFGFHHAPDPSRARSAGVVLCSPIGYEEMCARRSYRHLAERLAAAGFHALRFDYEGTGDSAGHEDAPGRVKAWRDTIAAAIDELRALCGARAIDLFGVRMGATFAAEVAGARGDVRGLVLWAPIVSGRKYVRELRAFRMMQAHSPEQASDASEVVAGYRFDKATLEDLSAIDLLRERRTVATRVLLLARDDLREGEGRLASHLEERRVPTLLEDGRGYAGMMRDPQDTVVPSATLDAIVAWTREGHETGTVARRVGALPSVLSVTTPATTSSVRETPVTFGEGGRLFGIVSESASTRTAEDRPAILLLNVGANHHVGPSRMYVTLARDLAGLGYRCFRFDVGGLGDSATSPGAPENQLYAARSIDDVQKAASHLAATHGVSRVVLLGVCSGAHLAFHTAKRDPRVVGQILINPQRFDQREGDSLQLLVKKSRKSTRYYMRAMRDPSVWQSAARGEIDVVTVGRALADRLLARARAARTSLLARLHGRPLAPTEIARAFEAMSQRGVETLFLYSAEDGGLDAIEEHFGPGARALEGSTTLRLEIVERADHTFTPLGARRELFSRVAGFLGRAFP